MLTCHNCKNEFPTCIKIDGKYRNLKKRKYCLICSPFGRHNTRQIGYVKIKDCPHECPRCSRIHNGPKTICGSCYAGSRTEKVKQQSLDYLGGKCVECGYNKCMASLHFHHKNTAEKEFGIGGKYCLSWDRLKVELDKCEILCANCHGERHWNKNRSSDVSSMNTLIKCTP